MDKAEREKLYEAEMGAQALERQQRLAKEQCPDCGGKRPQHHPLCRAKRERRSDDAESG
jgi:hypothetical protein